MGFVSTIRTLMNFLFHRRRVEREMEEEFRSHLALRAAELERQGVPKAEAERRARIEFGGYQNYKEECREALGTRLFQELWQDIRYGLRQLRRNPGFTIVAVLTLALGIGANTAIFSLIDAVALKVLPVKNPEQLELLAWTCGPKQPVIASNAGYKFRDKAGSVACSSLSYPFFEELRTHTEVFSSVFGFAPLGSAKSNLDISVDGHTGVIAGEMVTGDYFSGLGVSPILGRAIADEDAKASAPGTAVISYRYWADELERNPAVVGEALTLNGMPFTIIGVAPPDFFGVDSESATDIWVPAARRPGLAAWGKHPTAGRSLFASEDQFWLIVMGRLKPGITRQQASASLDGLFRRTLTANLKSPPKPGDLPRLLLMPAKKGLAALRQQLSEPLIMLGIIMGLVLLIACANVAILLFVRSAARRREIGVRLALGASRARLVRQLLTESVLLSSIGGALGLLLATWSVRVLLLALSESGEHIPRNVHPDLTVLGFTVTVSLLTGVLFGLTPSLRATGVRVTPLLKESANSILGGARQLNLRLANVLVVAQVAMALFLLVAAGLFMTTLRNVKNQDLGFDTHNLLLVSLDPTALTYDRAHLVRLYEQLQQRLEAVPGVRSATLSLLTLASGAVNTDQISIEGYALDRGQNPEIFWNAVGSKFFETMSIPLLLGRSLDSHDMESSPKVAVVNKSMARYFFGHANPIGRRFRIGANQQPNGTFEIVGVVEDVKDSDLHESPPRTVYIPYSQMPGLLESVHYEMRTTVRAAALVPTIRNVVHNLDPRLPIVELKTETAQINESVLQERLFAGLSAFAGAFALLLACLGLHGTVAYAVNRRTHEIGIRLALGAQRRDILGMVVGETLLLLLIGLAIGLPCALGGARLVSSMLFGLKPTDPLTFIAVSLILIAVALLACYIPARRAAKVDPMVALRYE